MIDCLLVHSYRMKCVGLACESPKPGISGVSPTREDRGPVNDSPLPSYQRYRRQRHAIVLSMQVLISLRELQSLLGSNNFLAPLVVLGCLFMCPFSFSYQLAVISPYPPILPLPVTLRAQRSSLNQLDTAWLLQGVPL